MVGNEARFDVGIHPAVHAANALHEAHRVPVQVVIDEPGSVLEIQPFGEHVGRQEDVDFFFAVRLDGLGIGAVVVGREAADHVAALVLATAAVDAFQTGEAISP